MKQQPKEGTQAHRAMTLLRRHGIVKSSTFAMQGMLRYGQVLDTLRKKYGFVIESRKPEEGNDWDNILLKDPFCKCNVDGPLWCPIHSRYKEAL